MVATKREFQFLLIFALSMCFLVSAYSKDYDYFWHVQNWQTSVCKGLDPSEGLCYAQDNFFIYGFWPEFDDGTYPLNCNGPRFEYMLVPPSQSWELHEYWPNKTGIKTTNFDIYKEAWEKHGVCSELNQRQYFDRAIAVMKSRKYDIFYHLVTAGIKPSNKLIGKTLVKAVISSRIGKIPGIQCWKNIETEQHMLTRVILCFERDGETLINCPSFADKDCPDSFIWPTILRDDSILAMSTDDH